MSHSPHALKDWARQVQHGTGWSYSAAKSFVVQHANEACTLLMLRGEPARKKEIGDELLAIAMPPP